MELYPLKTHLKGAFGLSGILNLAFLFIEDICDGSQTHPNVNRREARYKIRDRIRQRTLEWKGALKATQRMGKGLHKVFSTVVK